jgi:hypothetical protein
MGYEHTLKDYLRQIYNRNVVDTRPTKGREPFVLEKVLEFIRSKPKVSPLVKTFSDLKKAAEEEKRRLGEDLLEDFMITDLPQNPQIEIVYQQSLQHFELEGYRLYGFIGRGKLLRNSEGINLGLIVFTGTGYLSARVQKVRV